jgi:hypothetical protein
MTNPTLYRRTAWLSAFTALVVAVLPSTAWANCQCGPDGCGKGPASSSCCSVENGETDKPLSSCCAAKIAEVVSTCCCTQPHISIVCQHGEPAAQSDCECSPGRSNQEPAQQAPAIKLSLFEVSTLPLWAVVPPLVHDLDMSPRATDAAAFAPPIPVRELYCVWLI